MRSVPTEEFQNMVRGNFAERFDAANRYTEPLLRVIAQVYLACENIEQQWMLFLSNNIIAPGAILLFRPWITHYMYSFVFMRGGYETGATFYGHADAELGDDVISKFHYVNFTFYAKAMVFKPENIKIAEDVFVEGYLRGNDVKFIKSKNHLDFTTGLHRGDIISILVPYRTGCPTLESDIPIPADITGVHHYPGVSTADQTSPHYIGALYTEKVWGLNEAGENRKKYTKGFYGMETKFNTTVYPGHQIFFDRTRNSFSHHVEGKGHWSGNTVGRGAADVRNGGYKAFKEQHWSEYSYPA